MRDHVKKVVAVTSYSDLAIRQVSAAFCRWPVPKIRFVDFGSMAAKKLGFADLKEVYLENGPDASEKIDETCADLFHDDIDKNTRSTKFLVTIPPAAIEIGFHLLPDYDIQVIRLGVSPAEVLVDLLAGRKLDKESFNPGHPYFGAWDEGLLTGCHAGRYQRLSAAEARSNIEHGAALFGKRLKELPVTTISDWRKGYRPHQMKKRRAAVTKLFSPWQKSTPPSNPAMPFVFNPHFARPQQIPEMK